MAITKSDVRRMLIEFLDNNEDIKGMRSIQEVQERFVEVNKICPQVIVEIVQELAAEGYKLKDGRRLIKGPVQDIYTTREFKNELFAHKTYHAGNIICPRS